MEKQETSLLAYIAENDLLSGDKKPAKKQAAASLHEAHEHAHTHLCARRWIIRRR